MLVVDDTLNCITDEASATGDKDDGLWLVPQIRQVAPRNVSGEVDTKLDREVQLFLLLSLLLLLLVMSWEACRGKVSKPLTGEQWQ